MARKHLTSMRLPVWSAAAIVVVLFAAATISNVVTVHPLVFRALYLIAALIAVSSRGGATVILVSLPVLGVYWTSGQYSIVLAALLGELARSIMGKHRQAPDLHLLDVGVVLFVVAAGVSLPMSVDATASGSAFAYLITLFGLYAFLSRAFIDPGTDRLASTTLISVGTYSALIGIGQATIPHFPYGYQADIPTGMIVPLERATGLFENPNTFAVTLVMCLLLALPRLLAATRASRRTFWTTCCSLLVVALAMSLTRAAFVGLIVGVAVLAVTLAPRARRVVVIAGVGALLSTALVIGLSAPSRGVPISSALSDASSLDRIYLGRVCLEMWKDHPLAGVGVGAFAPAYPGYADPRVNVSPVTDPHQSVFGVPAETALLGFIAQLMVLGALLRSARRPRPSSEVEVAIAGPAIALAFLTMSALNTQHWLQAFWIGLAFAGAYMSAQLSSGVPRTEA